jgi:DNA-binding response OmpR family regulator
MRRVLLIEDHLPDAILLEEWLSQESVQWTVHHVVTCAGAELVWKSQPFDLVLLDLDIPDGLGMPLVHRVLTLVKPTPVVILSGQRDEVSEAEAAALGVYAYLVKGQEAVRTLVTAFRDADATSSPT